MLEYKRGLFDFDIGGIDHAPVVLEMWSLNEALEALLSEGGKPACRPYANRYRVSGEY